MESGIQGVESGIQGVADGEWNPESREWNPESSDGKVRNAGSGIWSPKTSCITSHGANFEGYLSLEPRLFIFKIKNVLRLDIPSLA